MNQATHERDGGYAHWAELFDLAWSNPHDVAGLLCPSCAERAVRFAYVVDTPDSEHGMFALWCAVCRRGFPPGYGPIPPGADLIPKKGEACIPNYELVVEELP